MDANFGQHPFVFDIEDYMREWRTKIQAQIDRFPIGEREGEWQAMIQKSVLSIMILSIFIWWTPCLWSKKT